MAKKVVTKSGRRLTEDELHRLARRAEAGFEIRDWSPRPGRPPLDAGTDGHAPRIAVRVPGALHKRVLLLASKEGRTVSDVVRVLLEGYARAGGSRAPRE